MIQKTYVAKEKFKKFQGVYTDTNNKLQLNFNTILTSHDNRLKMVESQTKDQSIVLLKKSDKTDNEKIWKEFE